MDTQIKDVKEELKTDISSIDEKVSSVAERVKLLEDAQQPSSTAASSNGPTVKKARVSSMPPNPSFRRSQDFWQSKTRGLKRAGDSVEEENTGRTNTLRLGKFPYQYSKTDLVAFAKSALTAALPQDKLNLITYHASNNARSVVLELPSTGDATNILSNLADKTISYKEDDMDDQSYELTVKPNSSNEVRNMGFLISILWKAAETVLKKHNTSSIPIALWSDRVRGKLLLRVGNRLFTIAEISTPDADGRVTAVQPLDITGLPSWITSDVLNEIYAIAGQNDFFNQ